MFYVICVFLYLFYLLYIVLSCCIVYINGLYWDSDWYGLYLYWFVLLVIYFVIFFFYLLCVLYMDCVYDGLFYENGLNYC